MVYRYCLNTRETLISNTSRDRSVGGLVYKKLSIKLDVPKIPQLTPLFNLLYDFVLLTVSSNLRVFVFRVDT